MKVEIWSDIMCPFCYIGKRKFEQALEQFEHKGQIKIEWKSFQLNSHLKTDPSRNVIDYLAQIKGWTLAQSIQMHERVTAMAKEVGLDYHFDKAIIANAMDAHRLIQFAKTKDKGDEMEERLFKAYFTEGKNTSDHTTLIQLANDIGLDTEEAKQLYTGNDLIDKVNNDIAEAQQIGVTGVPFFVINRRYAISGAQAPEVFLGALQKAWKEMQ